MNADETIKAIYAITIGTDNAEEGMEEIHLLAKRYIRDNCKHDWRFRRGVPDDYYQCAVCLKMRVYDHTEIGDIMNELAEARDD